MNPYFSIVIPTYNRAHLISKAIDSVIAQTFENWELIIVDDGSTDNTKELIASYQEEDSRVGYIYQQNAERSAARNKGIEKAKGHYICFLDSDDYYLNERLIGLFNHIHEEKEPKLFYYTAITYDHNGRLKERSERRRGDENIFEFIVQAIIGTPQVVLSMKILALERFNTQWNFGEDMELWLRLARIEEPVLIESQATVVATEHEERSINIKKYNSGMDQLNLFNSIFRKEHSGNEIDYRIKRRLVSNTYFSIFKFWCYNNNRFKALFYLLKSICLLPFHEQIKYRLNLLRKLVLMISLEKITKIF
jgi:glycosyltransferase involved in cell wall biosynthesis